ncbi:MAG: glycosyltransferase [Nocardioidaceae bacterium]
MSAVDHRTSGADAPGRPEPARPEQVLPEQALPGADDEATESWLDEPEEVALPPARITVVVVAHDGARWLPRVLGALADQTLTPQAIVAVDTGSEDASARILVSELGTDEVVTAPRNTGFGAAVHAALAHAHEHRMVTTGSHARSDSDDVTDWVWLLHDDSAPAPDALEQLLRQVARTPDTAVVGPKLREWPSLRRLLEVGVTVTGTGRRETGLERGEPDQGQHDRPRDVLAVSTAGMLIRRDAWDDLAGFDPHLPLFGDDLDLGWRAARAGHRVRVAPDAVVFHAEASTRGLRPTAVVAGSVRQARRAGALYALLVNASTPGFVWQWFRLLLGSVLRAGGLLLAKAPADALDELRAVASVHGRSGRLLAARRERRRTSRRPARAVRALLPPSLLPYRHGADAVVEVVRAIVRPQEVTGAGRRVVAVETGPVPEDAEELPPETGPLARLAQRPWFSTVLLLVIAALVSARGLYSGGSLQGGALLPAPSGIGSWWGLYLHTWHMVGTGSAAATPPYVALLGIAGIGAFGSGGLVVDVAMLGAVPLAGLAAHRLGRRLFDARVTQIWFAVTYAVVPVAIGAVSQGRLGTVVATVVMPVVVSTALSMFASGKGQSRWQQGLRLGLWLTLTTAFVPLAYPVTVVGLLVVAIAICRGRRWLAVLVAMAVPWLLLGWWMWSRALDPSGVWWEAGRADAGVGPLHAGAWQIALGRPGGPGGAPAWLTLPLLVAALVALTRSDRRRPVLVAWVVALTGIAAVAVGANRQVDVGGAAGSVPVWVGFGSLVWLGGLAAAAGLAAEGVFERLAGRNFGWRQPLAVAVTLAAAAVPLGVGVWWVVIGEAGPLERAAATPIPPYLTEAATGPAHASTLMLSGTLRSGIVQTVVRADGLRLGDEAVLPSPAATAAFDATVARSVSNPTPTEISELLAAGIGAIYAPPPVDPDLASMLDGAPGLQRAGTLDPHASAWQLSAPGGAVRLLPSLHAAETRAIVLGSRGSVPDTVDVPAGSSGRVLAVAVPASSSWHAEGPAGALTPVTDHGFQAFAVPAQGGSVHLTYESSRRWWLLAQLVLALVAIVLATPGRRREHR